MNLGFKQLVANNTPSCFVLVGVILGLLLSMGLKRFQEDCKLVEIDLKKIIHTYSVAAAKSKKPMEEIQQEFQQKFNMAIKQIPVKTIVVNKGQILSNHKATDHTKKFSEIMRIGDGKS